ncbi:hypothetical protein [Desulfoluna sp.]|uniref:hypothetical protein n=1 Tax=Desulfoluna sp. TaxID=2045199 RepID=UPI0026142DE0|nr:hypothetical protein [Desulfoluna sp.]
MTLPNDILVLYQPPYPTPCVFDLNARGLFSKRPPVTRDWGIRILVDAGLQATLQIRCITERPADDPTSDRKYPWVITETLLPLGPDLSLKPGDLAERVPDATRGEELSTEFTAWRTGYLPTTENGTLDGEALKRKLTSGRTDRRTLIQKELVRRNSPWIHAALPRMVQDFKRGLYLRVADTLYDDYRKRGGQAPEEAFLKKVLLFQRIYDTNGSPDHKPDGTRWKDPDETWECWVGFAGDEDEAKRVCRTLNAILRPLETPLAGEATSR